MTLYAGKKPIKTYRIVLGGNPIGDKEQEGDFAHARRPLHHRRQEPELELSSVAAYFLPRQKRPRRRAPQARSRRAGRS